MIHSIYGFVKTFLTILHFYCMIPKDIEKEAVAVKQKTKDEVLSSIRHFSLPRYEEIPNVGLYLEQTSKYISEYISRLGDFTLTGSMISNYVKKGLLDNPVKKQYNRDQIAYLFFISIAKTVLSIEDVHLMIELQKKSYPPQTAYDYFCMELENSVQFVFGLKEKLDTVGTHNADTKILLRNTIIAVAHKAYLDNYLKCLKR